MTYPSFNRSSREYHAPDVYAETQRLTDRKNDYETAQNECRPETYRDKFRAVYNLVRFYRSAFPLLSALTLAVLAFLLTLGFSFLHGQMEGKALVLGVLGFVGLIAVILINETVKSRTLKATFKGVALKRPVEKGTKSLAFLTTVLSIVGSASGIALLTYELTDKSDQINQGHTMKVQGIASSFSADSMNVAADYNRLIEDARQTIARNNEKISQLMAEKIRYQGDMVTPWKNRTIAEGLENDNSRLSTQVSEWQGQKVAALESARSRSEAGKVEASSMYAVRMSQNEETAAGQSWIAFAALVLLELVNIFAHFYERVYLARVEREGVEFGAIEPTAEKSAYEIQLSRLSAQLNQVANYQGLQLPGGVNMPIPGINVNESPKSPKIGFAVPWEPEGQPTPPGHKSAKKGGLNGGLNGVHGQADFSRLDPKRAAEIAGYLKKYERVVKSVMAGASNRKTAEGCEVSLSTVHNVKRCMRIVNLIPEPRT